MSQALTTFDKTTMPAHLADAFGDESNIRDRVSVPSLSYEGKVWQISLNGEKTKIMRRTAEGDEEPTQIMRVIVLGVAERRGRTLYEGAYDPTKIAAPLCWSDDGITPDKSIEEPKSTSCDTCPLSAKGSKVTEQGRAIAACSSHLMVAVVPHNKPDFTPLRLKLAITSVWDAQSPDWAKQNWYAFDNYRDYLRANGVRHTAMLVTKMRFDPNVPYPKVLFSPDRWLEPHEVATIKPILGSPSVTSLLGGNWSPAGVDGKPVARPVAPVAPVSVMPTRTAASSLDDEDDTVIDAPAAPPAKAPKPVKVSNARPKDAAPIEVDDGDGPMVLMPAKEAPPKAPPKVTTEVSDDVADLLKEWGEDE